MKFENEVEKFVDTYLLVGTVAVLACTLFAVVLGLGMLIQDKL